MPSLFDTGVFSVTDSGTGAVGAGWKLNFYQTGTTSRLDTYPTSADATAGTNPNTNPVVADAYGRLPAVWLLDQAYKCVLTDASGVVKATRDPVNSPLGSSSGSASVGFLQSGTGAVARTVQDKLRDVINAKDFGAVADGSTDDSVAVQAAATNGPFGTPFATVKTNTAVTGSFRAIAFGTTFSGTHPLDENYPAFGAAPMRVFAKGNFNSIVGIAHNNLTASTTAFPTGVTGYGRNDNAGNTAFGIYGEGRQYANTGVVSNELDSFNHGAAPSSNLPPNRSIGTAQQHPIALTVGAGGTANSSIGIHIAQEGSSPQKFLTGIYIDYNAIATYGMFIDAAATSPYTSAVIKHAVGQIGIQVNGVGTPVANGSAIIYYDGAAAERFAVKQDGRIFIGGVQVVSGRDTGWAAMTGTINRGTVYDVSTVTLAQLAGRVAALQTALTLHGIIGT